jgi:hypothetical protein
MVTRLQEDLSRLVEAYLRRLSVVFEDNAARGVQIANTFVMLKKNAAQIAEVLLECLPGRSKPVA